MSENGSFGQSENGAFLQSENGARAGEEGEPLPAQVWHSDRRPREGGVLEHVYTIWTDVGGEWYVRDNRRRYLPDAVPDPRTEDLTGLSPTDQQGAIDLLAELVSEGFEFETFPSYAAFYATQPWLPGDVRNFPLQRFTADGLGALYRIHAWQENVPGDVPAGEPPRWIPDFKFETVNYGWLGAGFLPPPTLNPVDASSRYLYEEYNPGFPQVNTTAIDKRIVGPGSTFDLPVIPIFPKAPTIELVGGEIIPTDDLDRWQVQAPANPWTQRPVHVSIPGGTELSTEVYDWFEADHTGNAEGVYVELAPRDDGPPPFPGCFWSYIDDGIDSYHDYYLPAGQFSFETYRWIYSD